MDRPDEPRTSDIFEQIPGYPKPDPVPLPDLNDLSLFGKFDVKETNLARRIIHFGMSASGFTKFVEQVHDEELEGLLRTYNLRLPGLLAPVLSATSALLDDPRPLTPFQRAATLVFGAYSLYRSVTSGELEADTLRGKPLEMGQYPNLFSTSLIVEGRRARLFKSVFEPQITVIIGGRLFVMQLGELRDETWVEGLSVALEKLASSSPGNSTDEFAIGSLTAADSPTQMRIFTRLSQSPVNAPNLRLLRRSFLTLCLDLDGEPDTPAEVARQAHSTNFSNRWFHSSLQLVVFGNSRACTILSFTAYLDGNVMMRGAAEIQKRAAVYPLNQEVVSGAEGQLAVQELTWEINQNILPPKLLQRAQGEVKGLLDTQAATFELPGYGRNFFEALKIPPIQAFILALQATSNQLIGRPAEIEQFASLSAYRCMDVTTAMVSTAPVMQFAQALNQADNAAQAHELLQPAIEAQNAAVRKVRGQIPMDMLIMLFMRSRLGGQRLRARLAMGASMFCLALLRQMNLNPMRDVLVSHPEIHPQVLVVGRPGIRLPYVKSFGLHYQIWPEKTVITFMPGLKWKTPNSEIVNLLQSKLQNLADTINP